MHFTHNWQMKLFGIGETKASESYLNMESIISATIATGADAIHPGFGFFIRK